MAFKSYIVTPLADGSWRLTYPEPVRFSGVRGLVARHLKALAPAESARWSLEDFAWLRLGLPDTSELPLRWLVFEQTENDELRLSRLHRINGIVSGGQTELLLMLSPLTMIGTPPSFIVTAPAGGRSWSEELALDGSPERPDAPWTWCERALHVGAAVLGGTRAG